MMKYKKVAIVYDWIDTIGGAERLLTELSEIFPDADWFTSSVDKERAPWAKNLHITPSFIQSFPGFIKKNRLRSLSLYPYAFESFNFSTYDLVISVTSAFAKAVITRPETKHVCIILTPTRFLWGNYSDQYINSFTQKALKGPLKYLKEWDLVASQRPDEYIAISKEVQERVKKIYKRDAKVIYPPFNLTYWRNIQEKQPQIALPKEFYLVVSRLEQYKRIDLAIKVCKELKKHLVIVGKGSQINQLKSTADPVYCHFLGTMSDEELVHLYNRARALIMPQEEDFGYASLEAQLFGCPVIAYRKGGASETVIEGKTGVLFDKQTTESLKAALEKSSTLAYNDRESLKNEANDHLKKFDSHLFKQQLIDII